MDDNQQTVDLGDNQWDRNRVETRKVQKRGRVDIPDNWLDFKGIEEGDSVMVVECKDGFYVTKSNLDDILGSEAVQDIIQEGE